LIDDVIIENVTNSDLIKVVTLGVAAIRTTAHRTLMMHSNN
jgi:hypothetical protein